MNDSKPIWLFLALALCLVPFMPSGDSIWIDEAQTAHYAKQPDLRSWLALLTSDTKSEAQMPLSMFLAWMFEKIFGPGEWELRAANMLWAAITLYAMWRVGRKLNIGWLALLVAVQPFFWSYVNEARPYALQMAAGAWLLYALIVMISNQGRGVSWIWIAAGAGFVLSASSLLGGVSFFSVVLVLGCVLWMKKWNPDRRCWWALAVCVLIHLPLLFF